MNKNILPYLLPMRIILFIISFLAQICIYGTGADKSNMWSLTALIVNILTITVIVIAAGKEKSSYKEIINYRKGQTKKTAIPLVIGMVIAGMAGMYLAGFILFGTIMPRVSLLIIAPVPAVLAVTDILLLPVTTTLAEDGLYLGCGVGRINNRYTAVIVPALLYALQHCFIPFIPDIRYILYRALSFLPLTVIYCIFYYRKRDPLPVMISHAILDLATAFSIFVSSMIPGVYEQMSMHIG